MYPSTMLALALLLPAQALSQSAPPDMKGTWKGQAQAAIIGANPYRVPRPPA